MKIKNEAVLLTLILIATVFLAIGYASITKNLSITGMVTAEVNESNFKVEFTNSTQEVTVKSNNSTIVPTSSYEGAEAILSVSGMKEVGDTVVFVLTITNNSEETANIEEITIVNDNETYFKVTTEGGTGELGPTESTLLTATVTCEKEIVEEQTAEITIGFTASKIENAN